VRAIVSFLAVYCVVFNNFRVFGSLLLSDVIYTLLAILMIFLLKNFKVDGYSKTLIIFVSMLFSIITFNFLYFENVTSLYSQLRFLWGALITLVFLFYFKDKGGELFFKHYLSFILLSSAFIIIQNFTYHILKFHFFLSFGEFDLMRVSTDGAVPGVHPYIRSGGTFREPAWFAIFAMPAIFMFHKLQEKKKLAFILIGLVLSTSSLGYLFILLFIGILIVFSNSLKLKITAIIVTVISFSIFYVVYLNYEFLFERLIFVLETGGSASIRLFDPLEYVVSNLSWFGTDTSFMKSEDEVFFVNTFLYVFFSFGFIGILLFMPIILSSKLKYLYYSLGILISIVIEGLSGRVDFWILLVLFALIRSGAFDIYKISQTKSSSLVKL